MTIFAARNKIDYTMATATIHYDGRSTSAKNLLAYLRTLTFIELREDSTPQYDPDMVAKIRRGEEDIKKGRCESIKLEELWN